MHDLVRAFVLSNFSNIKQASIVNHDNNSEEQLTKDANDSYGRVLLKCTGLTKFPKGFNFPNLSMLMLMDGSEHLEFPKDIYQRMEKLEVLSYEKMHLPLHQTVFEHLTKLRTLCLHKCSFVNDDISFVGNLSNLETLSIVKCKIVWLPSTIGKLKRLKLLDVTGCVDLCIDDDVFQNLVSLEELYMRSFDELDYKPIRFTDTNCGELEILSQRLFALELEFFKNKAQPKNMSFGKLKRFRISIGCKLPYLDNEEKYSFRNTIQFCGDYDELLECKISDLFEKTEELRLKVNDMNHLEDHSFSNLVVLYVSGCADLTYLFTADVASGLKKLEHLKISDCPVMRTLVAENSNVGVIRFQKLSFMSLTGLPKMVSLWDNVMELPEMVELIVDGLPNFTSIYPYSHNADEMRSLLNKKVVIPKLKKLDISRMENLKQIWSCEVATEKNNLFPSSPLPFLNHLEELQVKECGSIEVVFNIDFEGVGGIGEPSCRLRSITVEDLGKLKVLWRMKGVNNSRILINWFKGVESIRITNCSIFQSIFTPITINFEMRAIINYVSWNTSKEMQVSKGEITELDYYNPSVTYPSYLLHTCHHLQLLILCDDKRVKEVVFEMDSQPPLLLPNLESIELTNLKEMSHVWKCNNWNNKLLFLHHHHQPPPPPPPPNFLFPFQNLRDIYLLSCPKIKYLFSPLMAKYLSNLKRVKIWLCDGIEEVISSRDDENDENRTSASSYQDTPFFPHLDTLELRSLPCLESVDKSQSCQVFQSELSSNNVDEGGVHGTALTNPTLENIPQLSNLKKVSIIDCELLPHIFTFSTLESLKQLEVLRVRSCKAIQVIVKEEDGRGGKSSKDHHEVVFPRLHTLELDDLPNLKAFFLGMNEFRWPSLVNVMINDCPELMMFTPGHSKTPNLKHIRTSLGRHSLECGINFNRTTKEYQATFSNFSSDLTISNRLPWSFHNLIEIKRDIHEYDDVTCTTIIPSHAIQQLHKLEEITIQMCNGIEEVFEVVALELEGSGFNESLKIPNLIQLNLSDLLNLKYLWKSNQRMVLEFPNLTTVDISTCYRLEHVFTCSMVGSLVQLQHLHISGCANIEVIVKEEECDGKANEIMLPRLNSLKLYDLEKLKGFCLGNEAFSMPELDALEISYCNSLSVFTKGHVYTPELKVIDTTSGRWYLNTDLNSFINTKQQEGREF